MLFPYSSYFSLSLFFFPFFLLVDFLLVYCVARRVYDRNGKITCTYRSSPRPYYSLTMTEGGRQGDGITSSLLARRRGLQV